MEKAVILVVILLTFSTLSAEEMKEPESLSDALSAKNVEIGGYGAISMRFTALGKNGGALSSNSDFAYLIGAKGGITLNKSFTIGAGFYVLTNDIGYRCSEKDIEEYGECDWDEENVMISFGYGGLYMSYLFKINNYVGLDLGLLVGGGVIKGNSDDDYEDRDAINYSFFAAEPELELVIKVTDYFGIGLGAGYRYVGLTKSGSEYDWEDLSGLSLNFDLRLGVL